MADVYGAGRMRLPDDESAPVSAREKYRRIAEHRRYPKKDRYTLEDLTLGLTATDAGVNRYYAMKAGPVAKQALHFLAQATAATKPEIKAKALRLARKHLADISPHRHPELSEQIEGRLLWEEGHRPEADKPSVNPQTGLQEFFGPEDRFKAYKAAGKFLGLDLSSQNLDHYLGASGKDLRIDPQVLQKYPRIQKAMEENRNKFISNTFTN